MIALLSCFTSSYANNDYSLLRGSNDSTLISYNDLRFVNSKLIELEYTKQINDKYKELHKIDSTSIVALNNKLDSISSKLFISEYKLNRIKYYNDIAGNKNNIKYLRGWINRVINK